MKNRPGGVSNVSERDDRAGGCPPHGFQMWRWLVFDPPMRDPAWRGCRVRQVSCTACDRHLGTTDDPVHAVLMAWRHRRALRQGSAAGAT